MSSGAIEPRGAVADRLRDRRLAAAFPAVLVSSADGALVDADGAGRDLLPTAARVERWIGELLASAGRPGPWFEPAAVHVEAPNAEGVLWTVDAEGAQLTVMQLRDPATAPAVSDLAEQLHRYETVLATGPIFVHIYDRDMNSLWSTAQLRPELGQEGAPELTEEENMEFVHPDDRALVMDGRERMLAGEPDLRHRIRVRDGEGGWRWLEVIQVNLLDDSEFGHWIAHTWDVTEQVVRELEVEEGRRQLEALIDTLDDAVIVVAGDQVRFANAHISELLPALGPVDTLIGRPADELRTSVAAMMIDPGAFLEQTERDLAGGERVRGRVVETADGRSLEQQMVSVEVPGLEASRVWVLRDVTARRQAEHRRERLLDLERRARRGAEEQNQRLRELDELKNELVATVSHELRTPLSAVSSYIELLTDDADALTGEQHEIALAAARGVGRLRRLVDDLLLLAQLEARTLPVDRVPVDVAGAVTGVVDDVRAMAGDAFEIRADVVAGQAWNGDRLRLEQIVTNLLSNAVKFADGLVLCRASCRDNAWVIEVGDDGPGIPESEAEQVFEPFVRGQATRTDGSSGAGLGLPICARLAQRLGGTLQLAPAPVDAGSATGAWLRLTLPLTNGEELS